VLKGAVFDGRRSTVEIRLARHEHDRQIEIMLANGAQQLQATDPGHLYVAHDGIERFRRKQGQGLGTRAHAPHSNARRRECSFEHAQDFCIVIDQKNGHICSLTTLTCMSFPRATLAASRASAPPTRTRSTRNYALSATDARLLPKCMTTDRQHLPCSVEAPENVNSARDINFARLLACSLARSFASSSRVAAQPDAHPSDLDDLAAESASIAQRCRRPTVPICTSTRDS